ncbi:MAG TPA: 2-amino-4-hydroxy-6-hydroxymethyldihydropteridine diphosphokinase, partial [Firmicutes bacterium]|nr:2-amino-4-hydroxy-6-hydroxymethyldihydropteridine diphosphokinase [Bacillota bacterium]
MRDPLHGYLGLGSNLGNRLLNLQEAVDRLNATREMQLDRVSPVYESPAHGYQSPNAYLNAVLEVHW